VILDGSPNDKEVGENAVKRTTPFADPVNGYIDNHTQIAVSFVQIGDDVQATRFLKASTMISRGWIFVTKDNIL
jgi:hypothetical protein